MAGGSTSRWGQVFGSVPHLVKASTKDGGTNWQQVFGVLPGPAHARTGEASLELLCAAFDHTPADGPFFFAHLEIVHTLMVGTKIACRRVELLCVDSPFTCGLLQFVGNLVGVPLISPRSIASPPIRLSSKRSFPPL